MKGAPIRFVAAVVGGWVCVRIAVLLPEAAPLQLASDVLAPSAAASERPRERQAVAPMPAQVATRRQSTKNASAQMRMVLVASARSAAHDPIAAVMANPLQTTTAAGSAAPPILIPVTLGSPPTAAAESRWAASAWLLARGGASGTLTGGRLGASQAGMRVTYLLDRTRRIALAARIATPLKGRGTEAAVGIDWRPTAAPVHLVVEQRIAVDGARGGPTAMAIAGLGPTPVAGFRLEAYAQGGAILRGGDAEAFGDAAARLTRPVARFGGMTLDAGWGAWAAGQRDAARVDVGPTVGLALPLAGRSVRVSLDWRQRIAGDAQPDSGPALSIGSDF